MYLSLPLYKDSASPSATTLHHSLSSHEHLLLRFYLLNYICSKYKDILLISSLLRQSCLEMQIFKVFAIVTAMYTSSASACFQSGANWGDHNKPSGELKGACNAMAGRFEAGEVKIQCRNGDGDKSFMFEVRNQNNHAVSVDALDCFENIRQEIRTCGHGGEHTKNGIKFRYENGMLSLEECCG